MRYLVLLISSLHSFLAFALYSSFQGTNNVKSYPKFGSQWSQPRINSTSKISGTTNPSKGSDIARVGNKWALKAEAGNEAGKEEGSSCLKKAIQKTIFSPNYLTLMALTRRAPPVGSRFAFEDLGLQEALLVEGVITRIGKEGPDGIRHTMLDFKASFWEMVPDTQRRCVLRNNGLPWKAQRSRNRELLGSVTTEANTKQAVAQVLRDYPKFDFRDNNSRTFIKNVYMRIAAKAEY